MMLPDDSPTTKPVIMFSRDVGEVNEEITHLFSVSTPGQCSVKSRSIVYHTGSDDGSGLWTCSRDGDSQCGHITSARHHLQKLVHADPHARDPLADKLQSGHGT